MKVREEVLKAALLIAAGLETKVVKPSLHYNKKLNKVDSIRISIPIKWAEELGIKENTELVLIKDPETKSITLISKDQLLKMRETLRRQGDLI